VGAGLRPSLECRTTVADLEAPSGIAVRTLVARDVDAVVSIETEAFSSPWRRETFLDLIDRPGLELLVLEDQQAGIIGYAVLWCVLDQGELANMAVTPSYRRRGLGGFLLSRVLEVARERGVETVYLEVRVSNESAVKLYTQFGFSDVGLRRQYYERPKEDARVMRADLS
jgi:ribosomal-protein-alanine N-acetyltransferase